MSRPGEKAKNRSLDEWLADMHCKTSALKLVDLHP